MKKLIALLLALVMVFALVACGGDPVDTSTAGTDTGDVNTSDPGSDETPGSDEPAGTVQGVTDTEILIGNTNRDVSAHAAACAKPMTLSQTRSLARKARQGVLLFVFVFLIFISFGISTDTFSTTCALFISGRILPNKNFFKSNPSKPYNLFILLLISKCVFQFGN